ncbi:sugar ABC transporter substrate-binding protein [Marinovum sp. 2_MG-2023]|uniref:ABC transporter substrate-binding protein n=1 Tax=Roseobacteraceae TaxID=2854170 RepID=UPI001FD4BC09|nr:MULTISPECIES: sugar ABC transporter substrate-binding protein [Roseobacteraceae]MCJ7874064.1 sugar ABC transporter substrate-binding protein [Phaeobacter sp. J2-8]MDO6732043.1 sugar ABC transporter substrate-binding protein [Marinovum sp. 2_MG-2023]MDO6781295.1 sugar ABC transporter substrate-binding protein [Marinovum sp. 1_MG-2023]
MKTLRKTAISALLAASTMLTALPASAETLTFVSWMKDEPGYGDWWNEIIAEFEATHEGVDINMSRVSRDEYANTMFTMFAGGNPPDIVHLAAFEFQPFANEGWMEPLGPWIEKAGMDMTDWAGQSTCEWDGETVCVMLLYTGFVLAYNEKLFEEAGLDIPTDWESYLDAARKLKKDTDGDGINDQLGIALPFVGDASVMQEALNYVLDAGGSWTLDGEPAFDRPEVIEGLRRWKQLFDEGLTPKELTSADVRQFLLEGRLGMTVDGGWINNTFRSAAPEVQQHLKIAKSPFTPPLGGTSNVLGMPSDISDEKKQLVWDFIELTASQKYQQRFAEWGKTPAPRPGLDYTQLKADNPSFEVLAAAAADAAAANVDRLPKGLELENNEVVKIFFNVAQQMMIKDLSPEEAAKILQEEVTRIKG